VCVRVCVCACVCVRVCVYVCIEDWGSYDIIAQAVHNVTNRGLGRMIARRQRVCLKNI
jgi:hypothetical protein